MRNTSFLTEHSRDEILPTHRHNPAYAALVLSGQHIELSVDGPVLCEPGTLILHPPFHAHGNRFASRSTRVLNLVLTVSDASAQQRVFSVDNLTDARRLFECASAHLVAPLAFAARLATQAVPAWQHAYLDRLRTSDRPLGAIATELGVSAAHASRSVLRCYGMSPQQLRRELRWRHALRLLHGGATLAEIAAEAGFADQSHLTRLTRAFSGLPPAALRRQIKCVQDRPEIGAQD